MRRVIVIVFVVTAAVAQAAPAQACSSPGSVSFSAAMTGGGVAEYADPVGFVERRSIASAPSPALHWRSVVVTTRTWGDVSDVDTESYITPFDFPLVLQTDCGPPDAPNTGTFEGYATYDRPHHAQAVHLPGGLTPAQEARLERELGPPSVTEPGRATVVAAYARLWWPNALATVIVVLLVASVVIGIRRRIRRIDVQTGRAPA